VKRRFFVRLFAPVYAAAIDLVVTIDCCLRCRNLLVYCRNGKEWVMKRYPKVFAVLILLVFGAAASESATAQHHGGSGHGGGYGHGYGYGGSVRFGVNIGIPLFGPGYYPPYAYSAPTYVYPAPPYTYAAPAYSYPAPAYSYPGPAAAPSAAYTEQGFPQAAPAPAPQQDWYYCAGSNAYYPYVRECPGGWQRVPAQPPR
jgi:hypothetical protein